MSSIGLVVGLVVTLLVVSCGDTLSASTRISNAEAQRIALHSVRIGNPKAQVHGSSLERVPIQGVGQSQLAWFISVTPPCRQGTYVIEVSATTGKVLGGHIQGCPEV